MPLIVAGLLAAPPGHAAESDDVARIARGWAALRAMDCARCHGRDFDGWLAPSLLASARDLPPERFSRSVLDGNIVRGMPGYRSQPLVVAQVEAMYAYLLARARGEVGSGDPSTAVPRATPRGSAQSAEE